MNQISSLLKNNLPAKILSVFAAVVLWVFVMNEQNPAVNNTMKVALDKTERMKVVSYEVLKETDARARALARELIGK